MTAKQLRRISLLTGAVLVSLVATASAQDSQTPDPPPPSLPPKPVILPMTPGSQLQPKPKAPKSGKPRIISVPDGGGDSISTEPPPGTTATVGLQPERPVKDATSDYTFCNRTSYAVQVSVGIRNGGLWMTRGWWAVPAGECKVVIKGALTQPTYYSFARSSFAHIGPIRTWGGSQTLCTGKGNFQASSDGSDQCGPGYEPQSFAKVETEGKSAWTTTLTETPGYKSLEQARIAGLQRLLFDLGRFDGPIDGVAGPKFSEALAQARTALAILPNDASGMYTKLLAEAQKSQAAAGLTFCNRTQDIVWSALGVESQGKKQSQGWWRLQPGQCERVIKDRLVDRFIYAFATADRGEGENVDHTWGGTTQFCTRDASFEIEDADCAGRGFTNTGFLKIDTAGRPGITFEFAPRKDDAQQE